MLNKQQFDCSLDCLLIKVLLKGLCVVFSSKLFYFVLHTAYRNGLPTSSKLFILCGIKCQNSWNGMLFLNFYMFCILYSPSPSVWEREKEKRGAASFFVNIIICFYIRWSLFFLTKTSINKLINNVTVTKKYIQVETKRKTNEQITA